ncbi:MAG: hypothetical protein U0W24_07160 [Bacteroidales bacterium]
MPHRFNTKPGEKEIIVTEAELKYLRDLNSMSHLFMTMINDWQLLSAADIPKNLFTVSIKNDGFVDIEISNRAIELLRE